MTVHDAELGALIDRHGVPVRMQVGDQEHVLIGWLDRGDVATHGYGLAVAHFLRAVADEFEASGGES